jgi:hypothetical protein
MRHPRFGVRLPSHAGGGAAVRSFVSKPLSDSGSKADSRHGQILVKRGPKTVAKDRDGHPLKAAWLR